MNEKVGTLPALYTLQMQAAFVLLFSDMAEITGHFMFFDLPLGGLFFCAADATSGQQHSRFPLLMI
ncbi:hypothetical protein J0676_07885 [Vibrio sp. Vb2880]|uniref:hypothetical protein n=1 Tax=unclassified Vibrio TaxID=2614977 RepID=UPI001A8D249E|nr:hypothetical protein [Vibrio sp. Vb2880]MBO0213408.1 hypothetical protein [Vibrio sp. Vb2880]